MERCVESIVEVMMAGMLLLMIALAMTAAGVVLVV